ncbi:hypothetical protein CVV68_22395 [Arthrobacter livingstonensis]|uniref:Uncharacterized protein n=1 Tax=Arthrobacter livingstonensis TaxID=670078 RepID=A0A2V5LP61_9MICC|nr:hypothetical protein CVV68_22395 [Arthrobacter livingstonensis]
MICSDLAALDVAAALKVSRWLANAVVVAAATVLPSVDLLAPTPLEIDEHCFRSVHQIQK